MKSGAKSLCCLTTYDRISHTKLCAPFLVYVFLVTSFKCRFSVTIKESLMNKESVTDVLLIMSRMKHTLFWIALMPGLVSGFFQTSAEMPFEAYIVM
jgi:hypothetical protein